MEARRMQAMDSNDEAGGAPAPRRHVFGRRVGRGLGGALGDLLKTGLPGLRVDRFAPAPAPLTGLFGAAVEDVWLEIGFGGGEHLLWQAEHHPRIGIIGCEPFLSGVAKLVRDLGERGLANVRLHDDDARFLMEWLPGASIGKAFVLFPDPWPKKRHRKRRLLGAEVLASLARVIRPGGTLRFATDIADYAEMVLEGMETQTAFAPTPGLLSERPADWPVTRYEQKAIAAGRICSFFAFERR
jgi:tRNA (guanine-N7-)-methyltransferase